MAKYHDDEDDDRDELVPRGRTPDGRVYVHRRCGGQTRVSGRDFAHICDPFWPCTGTYCCTCQGFAPLSEVRWADTGEAVSDYRRRMRAQTPLAIKIWRYGAGLLPGAAIGALVGLVIALIAQLPPARIAASAGVGAILGGLLIYFIGVLILGLVLGVDYRRMR